MDASNNIVEILFSVALFVNAVVFIPQAINIFKRKTVTGISLVTVIGWLLIQLTVVLYGLTRQNYLLVGSGLFSLLMCALIIFLIYKSKRGDLSDVGFAGILEQLPGHVYWKDREGVYLGCNKNSWVDFGVASLEDFVGQTDDTLLSKHDADLRQKADKEIMSSGVTKVFEEELLIGNKRTLYLSHKCPLRNQQQQIVGILGVSLDITVAKREVLDKLKTLESIIAIMPGHVYWMDKEGVYLGCNDNQAKTIGFSSGQEIIGKRNTEIRGFMIPEVLDSVNKEVMEDGRTVITEEPAILNDETEAIFISTKTPLYSYNHVITGMVGISIDITNLKKAEREAGRLRLENGLQETKLQEQEKFRTVVEQVAHDIRSPLASLSMVVESCKTIPETERISLREIADNMSDIANDLLSRYKTREDEINDKIKASQHILVSLALLEVLGEKKYQYKNLQVKFNYFFTPETSFAFIKIDLSNFNRMISNLINNAVESFEGREGVVALKLNLDHANVKITIQDNGKGMAQNIVDKITNNISVTSGKKYGSGIGFAQVRNTLQFNRGKMFIESKVGKGTKITLTFPGAESVEWIAKKIKLNAGDTVVILDDDSSIHSAWETRFKPYKTSILLKHFKLGADAIKFIDVATSKEKIFLLSDFELINQELNGLQIIKQLDMQQRSILVTSHYSSRNVYNLATKAKVKIVPKQLATDVSIEIAARKQDKETNQKTVLNCQKVDLVIIDDVKMFADSLANFFQSKSLQVDVYYNPQHFLGNLPKYAKDTKIFLDNDFHGQMGGIELAKHLNAVGYTQLYMLSGKGFVNGELPSYLKILLKGDMSALNQLV